MREFKFRAFDPEARKMIYKPETLRRVLYYEKDNGFHMGRVKSKTNGDWVSFPIMQWTGLFDKTGNHIWEGDLIRVDMCECVGHDDEDNEIWEDCEGPVSFEDGMFVFDGHSAGTIPLNAYIENVTVIGNIYQNQP